MRLLENFLKQIGGSVLMFTCCALGPLAVAGNIWMASYSGDLLSDGDDKSGILDAALYMPYNDLCLMMQAREMSIGSFCNKSKYLGI